MKATRQSQCISHESGTVHLSDVFTVQSERDCTVEFAGCCGAGRDISKPGLDLDDSGFTENGRVDQRRYTLENMELADTAELEDDPETPDDAAENLDQQDTTQTRKRKRRKGRVPKGSDFWSCLETWWGDRIKEWGDNIGNSTMWKRFVVGLPQTAQQN